MQVPWCEKHPDNEITADTKKALEILRANIAMKAQSDVADKLNGKVVESLHEGFDKEEVKDYIDSKFAELEKEPEEYSDADFKSVLDSVLYKYDIEETDPEFEWVRAYVMDKEDIDEALKEEKEESNFDKWVKELKKELTKSYADQVGCWFIDGDEKGGTIEGVVGHETVFYEDFKNEADLKRIADKLLAHDIYYDNEYDEQFYIND